MKGAIYQDKESGRYIRMYSASEEHLRMALDSWKLVKVYDDHDLLLEDFNRLTQEQSRLEGQVELAFQGGVMKRSK